MNTFGLKDVLLAHGSRQPQLAEAIARRFEKEGYRVHESESAAEHEIRSDVEQLRCTYGGINAFVYFPLPLKTMSILEDDDLFGQIHSELAGGTLWLKAVGASMIKQNTAGRIAMLSHVTSIVPTGLYSYCSMGQAALNNLARVAALEWFPHGIHVNNIVVGWREIPEEQAYVEKLREVHQIDQVPLLPYVTEDEVADMCIYACDMNRNAFNGATLMVDGGYSVTRHIRPLL